MSHFLHSPLPELHSPALLSCPLPGLHPGHSVKSLHLLPPCCSWAPLECQSFPPGCSSSRALASLCRAHRLPHTTVPSFLQGSSPRPLFLHLYLLPTTHCQGGCQGKALCSLGTQVLVLSFMWLTPYGSALAAQVPRHLSLDINPRYQLQPFSSSHCWQ